MGSSGGGDSGAGSMAMMMQGSPMPGLPIAGKDTAIDPYTYGKFQNFLPEIQAEGQNPMATGLRPDMFKYRSPGGIMSEDGDGGGTSGEIEALRGELAKLKAGGAGAANPNAGTMYQDMLVPGNEHLGTGFMGGGAGAAGGGGGVGTMGMGMGGGYGGMNRMVNPPVNYQSPRAIAGGQMDPTIQQLDNAGTVFGLPPPGRGKDYRWSPTGG